MQAKQGKNAKKKQRAKARKREVAEIRIKMDTIAEQADEYYQKARNDIHGQSQIELVDPTNWLFNQDKMREAWEKYKNSAKGMGPFEGIMIDNSLGRYMQFMYDSYPANFMNEMKSMGKSGRIDGALVYYNLIHKITV